MSIAISVKTNNRAYMIVDSQVTSGGIKKSTINKQSKLISYPEEHVIIGLAGTMRDLNLIASVSNWIDNDTLYKDTNSNTSSVGISYIVTYVVPKLFKLLEVNGRMKKDEGLNRVCSELLFVYRDQMFRIGANGQVSIDSNHVLFIGGGVNFLHGAWQVLSDIPTDMTVLHKALMCANTACELHVGVDYPLEIMDNYTKIGYTIENATMIEPVLEILQGDANNA